MSLKFHPSPAAPLRQAGETLMDLLDGLEAELRGLITVAQRKLASLRAADASALNECTREEEQHLDRAARLKQRRTAIFAELAQLLPDRVAGETRLSELAAYFPEPLASRALAKSVVLRDLATQLEKANQLAATVARALQAHIRSIFAELAQSEEAAGTYGPAGRRSVDRARSWVEAVG